MSNDDDECDSNVASQSDVTSFLQAQSAKNTGLTSNVDVNDDMNDTDSLSNAIRTTRNSFLSQSCFASISPKSTSSDDLTELKWLNTFKLKDYLNQTARIEKMSDSLSAGFERMDKLIRDLTMFEFKQPSEITNHSTGLWLISAFYSKRTDPETPWSLTMKQCYEYFQSNIKFMVEQRNWKYLLRQTLISLPCFVQRKDNLVKSRLSWSIDDYYRPLLTRAYESNIALTSKKNLAEVSNNSDNDESKKILTSANQSLIDHYPPKATIKKAALPRLFERLCEESNLFSTEQTERKRARSTSLLETHRSDDNNAQTDHCLSSSSTSSGWKKKSKKHVVSRALLSIPVKHQIETSIATGQESTIVTPCPSLDHSYIHRNSTDQNDLKTIDDERDGIALIKSKLNPRRKVSPTKKANADLVATFSSHRAKTRMSRRIIEHDLKLLRQAQHPTSLDRPLLHQPLDLSTILLQ